MKIIKLERGFFLEKRLEFEVQKETLENRGNFKNLKKTKDASGEIWNL